MKYIKTFENYSSYDEDDNDDYYSEDYNETYGYYDDDNIFYHGTTDKNLIGDNGIHVGTYKAAKQALEARIGVPVNGEWDGSKKYGETLIAGKNRLKDFHKKGIYCDTGYNCGNDIPDNDYLPIDRKKRASYSDGTLISLDSYPVIFEVKIIGDMEEEILSDQKANELGNNRSNNVGYYYKNIGEDADSISAVVPNEKWLKFL